MRVFDNGGTSTTRYRVSWADEHGEEPALFWTDATGTVTLVGGERDREAPYGHEPGPDETEVGIAKLPAAARGAILDAADVVRQSRREEGLEDD